MMLAMKRTMTMTMTKTTEKVMFLTMKIRKRTRKRVINTKRSWKCMILTLSSLSLSTTSRLHTISENKHLNSELTDLESG